MANGQKIESFYILIYIMRLSLAEICSFTNSTPSSRNFIEGEKLLNAEHVIFCGKTMDSVQSTKFIAFCLQTSNMKDKPHEINGSVSMCSKIENIVCSCKAGLSKKCKHCVAVFLYLSRINIELDMVSSTDKKCLWKIPHSKSLEKYVPVPLSEHKCLQEKLMKEYSIEISKEGREKIDELLVINNHESALFKHMSGRHEPILPEENNNSVEVDCDQLDNILKIQPSECMLNLARTEPMKPLKDCCAALLNSLSNDTSMICKSTLQNRAQWKTERQFRITGSRCYGLFTYSRNKKANWEIKSEKYFFSKPFPKTLAMKHGIENEHLARETYKSFVDLKVYQLGLVVSEENPWLGNSPDGVTVSVNGEPRLNEINCPLAESTKNISEVLPSIKYFSEDLKLKQKSAYYAQIQLEMAYLNIPKTDFIIYASFDNSFFIN